MTLSWIDIDPTDDGRSDVTDVILLVAGYEGGCPASGMEAVKAFGAISLGVVDGSEPFSRSSVLLVSRALTSDKPSWTPANIIVKLVTYSYLLFQLL